MVKIFVSNYSLSHSLTLSGFPRTLIVVEMASYPGPDGEDGDGGQDEGEDGGPPHPDLLQRDQIIDQSVIY